MAERNAPNAETRAEVSRFLQVDVQLDAAAWAEANATAEKWRAARIALCQNPDAELPNVPFRR
jgi:hypothetical protein